LRSAIDETAFLLALHGLGGTAREGGIHRETLEVEVGLEFLLVAASDLLGLAAVHEGAVDRADLAALHAPWAWEARADDRAPVWEAADWRALAAPFWAEATLLHAASGGAPVAAALRALCLAESWWADAADRRALRLAECGRARCAVGTLAIAAAAAELDEASRGALRAVAQRHRAAFQVKSTANWAAFGPLELRATAAHHVRVGERLPWRVDGEWRLGVPIFIGVAGHISFLV